VLLALCTSSLALAALVASFLLYRQKAALQARLAAVQEHERRAAREKSAAIDALSGGLEALSGPVSRGLSAQQLARMIEDLLAFSRLGRRRPEARSVLLVDLVNRVIAEQLMTYAGRKVEFTVGELGAAEADPALLKQALANLIGNAVKYTRGRYPARVEIGREPPEAPGGATVYYVKDNGAGFDMANSHRLFGVFQRLHSPQEFEGTGVGLAAVERIVASHGGRIWAESRPNEGAVFYFTLRPD
jgi:light-regulated signal transduction histidine kinase (bacteriophytochrome)